MERDRQLSNVAFGGDWSEAIVPREQVQAALQDLRLAVAFSEYEDPRTPVVAEALDLVGRFARGPILREGFLRAAGLENPGVRRQELDRLLRQIVSVVGQAAG